MRRDEFLRENSIGVLAVRGFDREPAKRVAGHRSRIRRLRFRYANTACQVQQVSPARGPEQTRLGAVGLIRRVGSTNPRTRPTYETSTTRGYLRTPRVYNRFDVTPDPVNTQCDVYRAGTLSELDLRRLITQRSPVALKILPSLPPSFSCSLFFERSMYLFFLCTRSSI